jgi:hypothetical protein
MKLPWKKEEATPKDEHPNTYGEYPEASPEVSHLVIERYAREEDVPPGVLILRPGERVSLSWNGLTWTVQQEEKR